MSTKSHTTEGITVTVEPKFDGDITEGSAVKFILPTPLPFTILLAYTIKLLSRKWRIFDSIGTNHVVEGDGVVGLQPEISPGASFTYPPGVRWIAIWVPWISSYTIENTVSGGRSEIAIPALELAADWIKIDYEEILKR